MTETDWREALIEQDTPDVWPQIAVGDGWRVLIEYLYDYMKDKPLGVAQVKEKFGGLRFYIGHDGSEEGIAAANEAYKVIGVVEGLSFRMCEECGAPATKDTSGERPSWIRTECDKCRAARKVAEIRRGRKWKWEKRIYKLPPMKQIRKRKNDKARAAYEARREAGKLTI